MSGITTYKSKNKVYEIPEGKKDSFLESFPDAIEVESFTVGKDTFDIPIEKVDAFQSSMPEAKPVKKKDLPLIGEDSRDGTEKSTPEGFRTVTEFPEVGQVPVPDFKNLDIRPEIKAEIEQLPTLKDLSDSDIGKIVENATRNVKDEKQASIIRDAVAKVELEYNAPTPGMKLIKYSEAVAPIEKRYLETLKGGFPTEEQRDSYLLELKGIGDSLGVKVDDNGTPSVDDSIYEEYLQRNIKKISKKYNEEELDSFGNDMLDILASGTSRLSANTIDLMGWALALNAVPGYSNLAEGQRFREEQYFDQVSRKDLEIIKNAQEEEYGKAIGNTALQIAQSAPTLITLAMGNLAGYGNASLAYLGATESTGRYRETEDIDALEVAKVADAILYGLAEAIPEKYGTSAMMQASIGALKRGVKKEVVNDVIKRGFKSEFNRAFTNVLKGTNMAIRGGVDEMATGAMQNILDGKPYTEGLGDQFVVGFMMDGIISSPQLVIETTEGARDYAKKIVDRLPKDMPIDSKINSSEMLIEKDVSAIKEVNLDESFKGTEKDKQKELDNNIKLTTLDKTSQFEANEINKKLNEELGKKNPNPEVAVRLNTNLKSIEAKSGAVIDKNSQDVIDNAMKGNLPEEAISAVESIQNKRNVAYEKAFGNLDAPISEVINKENKEKAVEIADKAAKEAEISEETTPVEEKPTKEVKVAEKPSNVEPKKEKDGVQKDELQKKRTEEKREGVSEEVTKEKQEKRIGEEEVLEKPKTTKEAESNIKMLETEKASLQESLKDLPEDQKSKLNQEIQAVDNQIKTQQDYATEIKSREVRQEIKEEKGKGVSDKDMPEIDKPIVQDKAKVEKEVALKIDRKTIESRAKESIGEIGDVTKKTPIKLAQESQSFEELDYLYEIYPKEISFKEYGRIKNKLRNEGLFDDTSNRIEGIRDQVIENQAKKLDSKIKNELGNEKYSELKAKRAAEIDKINDSFAKIAGVKFAVGDGKKIDLGKEMVTIAKGLIGIGVIDIRLGTKAAMDKLKSFFDISAPEKSHLVNEYKNLVAKELGTREFDKKIKEADVEAIDKRAKERLVKRGQAEKQVNESRKKKAKSTFQRLFVDKSEPFKVAILKERTELSKRAVDYFNLQAGVSGRNMSEFETTRKKVLGKFNDILNEDQQRSLEEYITLKRVIELDTLYDKRGANRLDHESGLDKEEAEIVLAALENNDKSTLESHGIDTPVDWAVIKERAQAYWGTMQGKLKDLYDNGLITEDVYNKLSEEQPHYTPRRYLEHFIGNVDKGGSISGIDALSGGSMGSILADIQTLLADVIARTNRSIARNKTLTSLHDVAVQNPNDVIKPAAYKKTKTEEGKTEIGYTDKIEKEEERLNKLREKLEKEKRPEKEIEEYIEAERKYIDPEFEQAPSGYTTYKFKKNGVTDAIYLNNEYIEDFEQKPDSETMRMIKNGLSWVSGNKILKAFATGYNPEFAIKNLPLDMLHILTSTEAYSPVYPVATAQLAKDIVAVSKDAFARKGRYKDFVEEGGSMEFLSTQGSLAPKKFKAYNKLSIGAKALADGAAYLGNTSEILTRLALRERMIKNITLDFKKKNDRVPNTVEKKEIQERATAYSRNYLDFSHGGAAIKFLNSVIPYLNAGFQVTRGSLRASQRNPKIFWFKMSQLAATATAITAYNLGLTGEDEEKAKERREYYLNDISDRRKTDNFVLMTNIDYKDNKGVKHYVYFAFPKDNIQKMITGWAESALAASIGVPEQGLNERRWMEIQSLTQNLTDIGNLPPVHSALLGSSLNKDLYYRTDLWGGRDLGKYKSQEYSPGLTPQRYIKAGEWSEKVSQSLGFESSLSPVRMQYFISQFTTKSNVIGTAIGEALDMTMVGVDKETQELINKTTGERLVTAPFSRRFFKKTSPYVKKSSAKEEQAKLNAVKQKNDNILNPLLKKKDYKAIIDHITKEPDPYEAQRMIDKLRTSTMLGDTDYRILELTFVSPKARARAWYNMYGEADDKGKKYLIKESTRIGGVFTSGEFMNELGQIMLSDKNLEKDMNALEKEKR